MFKVFKYSLFDQTRSKWIYLYTLFFFLVSYAMLYLNNDLMSGLTNLLNISLLICPLVSIIFGTMYFYNSREFTDLLLAQPIKRTTILLGQYFGLSSSLSLAYLLGNLIPFILYGVIVSDIFISFIMLLIAVVSLTFIFSGFAIMISLITDNRIKGFGFSIFLWLFMTFIYDGIFLLTLFLFSDYPMEIFSISVTMLNPVDLARILIMLKLDITSMLGYTGAVFNKFFGSETGIMISSITLIFWLFMPVILSMKIGKRKDF
ncbi:ABC transporter permease [Bacteroidetes/Chlorobi group bacterium ChocPot_Mid]|nr:MAG: ABC transporter permease [Bacteroidetes/Chlorobi group bacterium ChocPot_Mid]